MWLHPFDGHRCLDLGSDLQPWLFPNCLNSPFCPWVLAAAWCPLDEINVADYSLELNLKLKFIWKGVCVSVWTCLYVWERVCVCVCMVFVCVCVRLAGRDPLLSTTVHKLRALSLDNKCCHCRPFESLGKWVEHSLASSSDAAAVCQRKMKVAVGGRDSVCFWERERDIEKGERKRNRESKR